MADTVEAATDRERGEVESLISGGRGENGAISSSSVGLKTSQRSSPEEVLAPLVVLKQLVKRRAFWHLTLGKALLLCVAIGSFAWMPTFYVRNGQLTVADVGMYLSIIVGSVGMCAQLLGGMAADHLFATTGDVRWYAWVPAITSSVATPFALLTYWVDSSVLSLGIFIIPTIAANCFDAPTSALLLSMTQSNQRGVAYSFFHFVGGLVAGAGPWLVGMLSDALAPGGSMGLGVGADGEEEVAVGLRRALMAVQLLNLWAAMHFVLAARSLREEAAASSSAWAGGRANE